MVHSFSAYPEQDAAVERALQIVDDLLKEIQGGASRETTRLRLVDHLAAELQQLEFDARSDERAECAQIVAQVFPPAHPSRRDAEEAIRRIRARDTQP
ncbi:MAG: hypothetical protein QHJ73_02595 [Armatimonadota bacterium]|nr:hypothetical protein [Armatimonadota bacterium]